MRESGRTIAYFTLDRMGRTPHGGIYALRYPDAYRLVSVGQEGKVINLLEGSKEEVINWLFNRHRHYQDDVDYTVSDIRFEDE